MHPGPSPSTSWPSPVAGGRTWSSTQRLLPLGLTQPSQRPKRYLRTPPFHESAIGGAATFRWLEIPSGTHKGVDNIGTLRRD